MNPFVVLLMASQSKNVSPNEFFTSLFCNLSSQNYTCISKSSETCAERVLYIEKRNDMYALIHLNEENVKLSLYIIIKYVPEVFYSYFNIFKTKSSKQSNIYFIGIYYFS